MGMARKLDPCKQEKKEFGLSDTSPILVVNYHLIRGPGRKLITKGEIGESAGLLSETSAIKGIRFEYKGLMPGILEIKPTAHLYVVLDRRMRRSIVALIDSEHAWLKFRRHFGITERTHIRYRVLSSDESRDTVRKAHLNAGLRRQPASGWT